MQKGANQTNKSHLLRGRARIFRIEPATTSDVSDAYRVRVMEMGVSSSLVDWTASLDCSVKADQEMISYTCEASGLVPAFHVCDMIFLVFISGSAMDYDFI